MHYILVTLISLYLFTPATRPSGFFFALDQITESDRLYRVEFDGNGQATVVPIGPPGQLGFSRVTGLVWDSDNQTLYGFDTLVDAWLSIDTDTGIATEIGSFSLVVRDLTYNPNDGLAYGLTSTGSIYSIVMQTGESTLIASSSDQIKGLTHTKTAIAGRQGLYTLSSTLGSAGLTLWEEPTWQPITIGGNATTTNWLFWEEATDTLFKAEIPTGGVLQIMSINKTTGHVESEFNIDFSGSPLSTIISIAFIAEAQVMFNPCVFIDLDQDNDIDLKDFANFANCFNDP